MTLHILANSEIKSFQAGSMSIAGRDILEYWLEWARYKEYKKVCVYTDAITVNAQKLKSYSDLYGVNLEIFDVYHRKDIVDTGLVYRGIGIFLDDCSYKSFDTLDEILTFEQLLIDNPLKYCSSLGYGKMQNIHIGKNVYIHASAILEGKVIIGDNCTIEKDVHIQDSVIDSGCTVKSSSIVKKSHVSKNIQMTTNLFLNNKVLFQSSVYDVVNKNTLEHEGLCLKAKAS